MTERPPLEVLRYIEPAAFTERHFQQLQRLGPMMWDGQTPFTMAREIYDGMLHVWEVEGTEQAVVLTRVVSLGPDNTLWLDGLAGDGILRLAPAILSDLRTIAVEYGCPTIGASTKRGGFEVLYEKFGFIPVAITYTLTVEEPDDGRIEADADPERDAEG